MDENRKSIGEYRLTFLTNASLLNLIESLSYSMVSKDAIETGFNPFLFGDTDMEASQQASWNQPLAWGCGSSFSHQDQSASSRWILTQHSPPANPLNVSLPSQSSFHNLAQVTLR